MLNGWLTRRREREKDDLSNRRAARLINADIWRAVTVLEAGLRDGRLWPVDQKLTSVAWEHHRDIIAPKLSWSEWQAVVGNHDDEQLGHSQRPSGES